MRSWGSKGGRVQGPGKQRKEGSGSGKAREGEPRVLGEPGREA